MAGMDEVTRILKMYESMRGGGKINKAASCLEYEISERTFQRDMQKIRIFLSEEYSGWEIQGPDNEGDYWIPGSCEHGELTLVELALIIKILKSEQALEKNEFEGFVGNLQSVAEKGEKKTVQNLFQQEISQYNEREGQKAFLKLFGDLQKCIMERNVIRLELKENRQEKRRIRFYPVAVECQEGRFYLLGFQEGQEFSAFFLDEIESFQTASQKYDREIAEKYSYREGKELYEKLQEKRREDT